jgi:hypothetical protein
VKHERMQRRQMPLRQLASPPRCTPVRLDDVRSASQLPGRRGLLQAALVGILAACVLTPQAGAGAGRAAMVAGHADVMLVWSVPAPQSQDPSVQAVEAGALALNFLTPQLAALERHPETSVTIAFDPVFVAALERAASGDSAAAPFLRGQVKPGDPRTRELLAVLARDVVPTSALAQSAAARRLRARVEAVRDQIAAHGVPEDDVRGAGDLTADALVVSLAGAGYGRDERRLADKPSLNEADRAALARDFASACRDVLQRLKNAMRTGHVEPAALPAYEPIMPLVVDAAGRTESTPFTVNLGARADVGAAIDDGLKAVRDLDPHAQPGVVAPAGAYDDDTAVLLRERGAHYAIFSDRVLQENVGAAPEAVAAARSAAFHGYLLETSRTDHLPLFFCDDDASTALEALPAAAPSTAYGDRLAAAVRDALAVMPAGQVPLLTVCVSARGAFLRRADRRRAADDLAAALAGGEMHATTPGRYLDGSPALTPTYGYEAASALGGFDFWMGSRNQMNLWTALAEARQAAGSDAAIGNPRVRDLLLQAESGRWFAALSLPQPAAVTQAEVARFRDLLAAIYRAVDLSPPARLAPIMLPTPAPPVHASPIP